MSSNENFLLSKTNTRRGGILLIFVIMFRNASSISTTNSKSQNYPSENTRGHVEFCCNDTTTYCCSSKYVPPLLLMFIVRSSIL